jgi:hypothetical protein
MLKIDMTSFAGSMVATIANTRKQKENNTTKTNEDKMSDDNNSENQDLRESFETQTISKLSMEFLDSVCFYIFFFVLLPLCC